MNTDNIFLLGDDQLANQFQLVFPEGIPGGGDSQAICMRMDQSFDPPEKTIGTYEIIYRGLKIPKTNMLDDTSKELTFDVRVDQNWKVFDAANNWFRNCYDPVNGIALPDSMTRTTLLVQSLDGNNAVKKTFRFKGVKLKALKVQTFDNSSGDPLRMTMSFIYQDMIEE